MSNVVDARFPRMRGAVRLPAIGGVPIDLHWTCVLGGIVLSAAGSFRLGLVLPLIVGYLLVLLLHEAAHAFAARWLGLQVHGIRLKGMGGVCVMQVVPGARATLIVYSAGLVAQLLLFEATLRAHHAGAYPEGPVLSSFVYTFTFGNAFLFACSIFPWTSRTGQKSDGRVLLQLAVDRWHGRTVLGGTLPAMNAASRSPVFEPGTSLLGRVELVPTGFLQGVEILNDRHTPLDFVIDVLIRHAGLDGRQAIEAATQIHNRGGILLPSTSMAEAERIAAAVRADASVAGHPLVCRAVSTQAVPAA